MRQVHSAIGMVPTAVTDRQVLEIWTRMNYNRSQVRVGKLKFQVGQHVSISKEKMKFSKGWEQYYKFEIFRIRKMIRRTPRPVYELEDLYGTLTKGNFYGDELTPVRVTKRAAYKIDKILDRRYRNCIVQYLLR